jgi:hypothetical protein
LRELFEAALCRIAAGVTTSLFGEAQGSPTFKPAKCARN